MRKFVKEGMVLQMNTSFYNEIKEILFQQEIKSIKLPILQWLKPTGILEKQSLKNKVAMRRQSMVQVC